MVARLKIETGNFEIEKSIPEQMSELYNLFLLANLSHGKAREIAEELLIPAIEKAEWTASGNQFMGPLGAGHDAFTSVPEIPVRAYKTLLRVASDKILSDCYKIRDLETELKKLSQKFEELEKKAVV